MQRRRQKDTVKAKAKAMTATKRLNETAEALDRSRKKKRPRGMAMQTAARAEEEKAALKRNLEQLGSRLSQSSAEPAALRLERLNKRVRLRLGGEPPEVAWSDHSQVELRP